MAHRPELVRPPPCAIPFCLCRDESPQSSRAKATTRDGHLMKKAIKIFLETQIEHPCDTHEQSVFGFGGICLLRHCARNVHCNLVKQGFTKGSYKNTRNVCSRSSVCIRRPMEVFIAIRCVSMAIRKHIHIGIEGARSRNGGDRWWRE